MRIVVTREDVERTLMEHQSTATVTGTAPNGQRVRFSGNWRAMRNMADAALQNGSAVAQVAPSQVHAF